ncbi:uncharacterized protein Hap1MRO34_013422 [Clarias gariepinus]
MEVPLWIRIISICCMFCKCTCSEVAPSTVKPTVLTNTTTSQAFNSTTTSQVGMIISVSITLIALAAISITVLVLIYRRKRGGQLLQRESVYYGNSEVFRSMERNGYKSSEKEKDDVKPEPQLPPKEEPIYINLQNECTQGPSAAADKSENIYCNIKYETQK